jgi:hypothetical protein
MWLPTRLYESLPAVYIACGTLMITFVAYIGITSNPMPAYFAIGVMCIATGLIIHGVRRRARAQRSALQRSGAYRNGD